KKVTGISPDAMDSLVNYHWPGNVRELRTAIEHGVVLCRGEKISVRDLPASIRGDRVGLAINDPRRLLTQGGVISHLLPPKTPLTQALFRQGEEGLGGEGHLPTVKEAEKQLIIQALKEARDNRTVAARRLGMSRRTLHRKLHTYDLERKKVE